MRKRIYHFYSFSKPCRLLIAGTLLFLFIFTLIGSWAQARWYKKSIMINQLQELAKIFKNINETAGIESFEHQINYIDFLNVKKFKGSTLGSINLRFPERWQGPYVTKNPTIQGGHYYLVVRTTFGYFIVPDRGVKLPNGMVMGTDIMLNETTNLRKLAQDKKKLNINGHPFAVEILITPPTKDTKQSTLLKNPDILQTADK